MIKRIASAILLSIIFISGRAQAQPSNTNVNTIPSYAKLVNGSATAPAVYFGSDPDTGLYRIGANNVGAAAGGALIWNWNTFGVGIGTGTADVVHRLYWQYNSNTDIQAVFWNTSTGSGAATEVGVKSDTTRVNISVEGINSSDAFGAERAQIYSATGSGTAGKSGIDIVSCEAATPTACFTRFVINGLSTGTVRATINATGLQLNNNSSIIWTTDNGADIGASGATRPRTLFAGTSVVAPLVNIATSYQLNGVLFASVTAPTIASGGCTSPAVTHNNGTIAFLLTIGSSCSGVTTITLTLPASAHFWACGAVNNTSAAQQAANAVLARATSTTAVVLTNYSTATALATDFTASDTILVRCSAE